MAIHPRGTWPFQEPRQEVSETTAIGACERCVVNSEGFAGLPKPRNQEDDSRPEGAGRVKCLLEGLQRYSELVNNAFVSVSQKMILLLGSGK